MSSQARRIQYTAQLLAIVASAGSGVWARSHATSVACFSSAAFAPSTSTTSLWTPSSSRPFAIHAPVNLVQHNTKIRALSKREGVLKLNMSFFGGVSSEGGLKRIDKEAMMEIIEDIANSSREECGYVVIDVRGYDEIEYTGKLHEVVETLPLPYIAEGALAMDDEDFEDQFGFEKPKFDETIVFSCKAGIRSVSAAQLAKMAGYTDVMDYMGGSNDW
eukprot:CAMPEP_0171328068 /NCGR_PEP_ID=MMETSP0878-20121228/426_1 /TAXON_ID=67004 /ORGANISM="Thalassiosira weissflogii, Strain CCMP1336" /LENGTH=217 /DNA_ID=CAMNT_0011827893 /DNA_START=32 /DNA_END=682 /DNA_ORIENTATION=+